MDPPQEIERYIYMQPKKTIIKLFKLAESYVQLNARMKSLKNEYHAVRKQRSINHIKEEVRKVPIPLSFTLNNMIIDQKIGKVL